MDQLHGLQSQSACRGRAEERRWEESFRRTPHSFPNRCPAQGVSYILPFSCLNCHYIISRILQKNEIPSKGALPCELYFTTNVTSDVVAPHVRPRETRSWYSAVQSVYNSVVALKRLIICSSRFLLAERYPMMRRTVASTIPVKKSVCKHRFPTKTQHIANKNDNVLQNYKIN